MHTWYVPAGEAPAAPLQLSANWYRKLDHEESVHVELDQRSQVHLVLNADYGLALPLRGGIASAITMHCAVYGRL
jgi:hypothetical protein